MVCRTGTATREAAADTLRTGGPVEKEVDAMGVGVCFRPTPVPVPTACSFRGGSPTGLLDVRGGTEAEARLAGTTDGPAALGN